jgi:general secretion pathway protein A
MPIETLENLRMLSNLETSKEKLLQIILIGQTEFDKILDRQELRQLKQRVAIRALIRPLSQSESLTYIKHRLSKAGMKEGQVYSVFSKKALQHIIKEAKGIPRTINILCDNALLNGFGLQQYPVTEQAVEEAISDLKGSQRNLSFVWQCAALAALILLFLGFWMSPFRDSIVSTVTDLLWTYRGSP